MRRDLVQNRAEQGIALSHDAVGNFLVREIDSGFDPGGGSNKAGAPGLIEVRKLSAQLVYRLTALGFGLGIDEIGYRLGLGQVQAAVFHRPAREFAWFRWPQTFGCQGIQHSGNDRSSTMYL